MNGAGETAPPKFTFLAHVNQREFVAAIESFFNFVHCRFTAALLAVVPQLQKTRRMLGHDCPPLFFSARLRGGEGRTAPRAAAKQKTRDSRDSTAILCDIAVHFFSPRCFHAV